VMRSPIVEVQRALRSLGRSVMFQTRLPIGRAPYVHARGQINPFTLEQPSSLREAARGLANTLDARLMAGGIDLLNEMKLGAEVRHVVHLAKVAGMRGIEVSREFLTIGAATTHAQIERDANVAVLFPNLPDIVSEIANVRVRAVGTIGGNVMIGSRGYDWLPILLALGAEISFEDRESRWYPIDVLATRNGRFRIPLRLLREIRIPLRGEPVLLFNRDLKPAISMATCLRSTTHYYAARIAVGCVHDSPVVRDVEGFDELDVLMPSVTARSATHTISGRPRAEAIAELLGARVALRFPKPHDDGLGGAGYRQAMIRTLAIRSLQEALEHA
jgi:carbon-monoxide dehydrogenase medium subunit